MCNFHSRTIKRERNGSEFANKPSELFDVHRVDGELIRHDILWRRIIHQPVMRFLRAGRPVLSLGIILDITVVFGALVILKHTRDILLMEATQAVSRI